MDLKKLRDLLEEAQVPYANAALWDREYNAYWTVCRVVERMISLEILRGQEEENEHQ